MKIMTKHSQSRAIILQSAGIIPNTGKRKTQSRAISEQDYTAVPPPLNLQVHPTGDCLIWLWRLNADGYGTVSFPDQEQLPTDRRTPNLEDASPTAASYTYATVRSAYSPVIFTTDPRRKTAKTARSEHHKGSVWISSQRNLRPSKP